MALAYELNVTFMKCLPYIRHSNGNLSISVLSLRNNNSSLQYNQFIFEQYFFFKRGSCRNISLKSQCSFFFKSNLEKIIYEINVNK